MGYYPVFLEMKDRRCVVIGGGAVAERRVEGLVAVGANVTVISPTITDRLRNMLTQGAIRHVAREYRAGDRAGYDLVFVATDNSQINAAVSAEVISLRIWLNSADDPDHCDFILPGGHPPGRTCNCGFDRRRQSGGDSRHTRGTR
jgi:siroheme synthase-like protein